MTRLRWVILALPLAAGCFSMTRRPLHDAPQPPGMVLGEFVDDYDSRYVITATEWRQGVHGTLHIIKWDVARQFIIAGNDSANQSDPGKYTRIDYLPLDMAPYTWAYCYSAYNAGTAAAAEAVTVANRAAPRTGCNGHPFSRMKRP